MTCSHCGKMAVLTPETVAMMLTRLMAGHPAIYVSWLCPWCGCYAHADAAQNDAASHGKNDRGTVASTPTPHVHWKRSLSPI